MAGFGAEEGMESNLYFKAVTRGRLGSSVVEHLPSAQDMIPRSGIESHIRLLAGSLLFPLPMPLPMPLFLCLS